MTDVELSLSVGDYVVVRKVCALLNVHSSNPLSALKMGVQFILGLSWNPLNQKIAVVLSVFLNLKRNFDVVLTGDKQRMG